MDFIADEEAISSSQENDMMHAQLDFERAQQEESRILHLMDVWDQQVSRYQSLIPRFSIFISCHMRPSCCTVSRNNALIFALSSITF